MYSFLFLFLSFRIMNIANISLPLGVLEWTRISLSVSLVFGSRSGTEARERERVIGARVSLA